MSFTPQQKEDARKDLAEPFLSEEDLVSTYSKIRTFIEEGAANANDVISTRNDAVESTVKNLLNVCSEADNLNHGEMTQVFCNFAMALMSSASSGLGVQCIATASKSVQEASMALLLTHMLKGTLTPKR